MGDNNGINSKWLRQGPKLEELVARVKDGRKARKKTAIIIPTYKRRAILVEHLKRLAAQTYKDFDVIIIYNEKEEFLDETPGITAVHVLQSGNRGSAGSFYCGQKFALEAGYDKIIMADDDCLPVSRDLLLKLTRGIDDGADVVFPKITDELGVADQVLWQYGCVRASVLRKVGLAYLPFYFAGEDVELEWRMLHSGAVRSETDAVAYHRSSHLFLMTMVYLCSPQRVFYYNRALALFKYISNSFPPSMFILNLFFISGAIALMPIKKQGAFAIINAFITAATMGFFRNDRYPDDAPQAIDLPEKTRLMDIKPERAEIKWPIPLADEVVRLPRSVLKAASVFGKDVLFSGRVRASHLPIILAARRCYLENYGEYYLITDNRYFWLAPLSGAFILIMPFVAIIPVFLLTCMGFVMLKAKGINTYGYGLEK